jgi:Sortase domain
MRHDADGRGLRLAGESLRVGLLGAVLALCAVSCAGAPAPAAHSASSVPSPVGTTTTLTPRAVVAPAMARSAPVRLRIASIGLDSPLMKLGLQSDGTMQVPPSGFPAGWYTGSPTPGEVGPAIIAGHIDWNGPGVFYNLHKLKPGNQIVITRKDGSSAVFRVTRVAEFPKSQFPTNLVYGNIDHPGLRLITCGGTFNRQSGHYEDNIVAFADLVQSQG